MADQNYSAGQRLSLKRQACTVRYVGIVDGKSGTWLGVEWDDTSRGKHDGSHEGKRYFHCRSPSLTAASFLRPTQDWDKPRSFLEALEHKYFRPEDARAEDVFFVSRSKQIEEVGFEKFAQRQAELRGIHVLVLDHMQIQHKSEPEQDATITSTCAHITDLDIGYNLFETWQEVQRLIKLFPRLTRLTLDGNRFSVEPYGEILTYLPGVKTVSLAYTLLQGELRWCLSSFPEARTVQVVANHIPWWPDSGFPLSTDTIDLSENDLEYVESLTGVLSLPRLRTLILKRNRIHFITKTASSHKQSDTIEELDLSQNNIMTPAVIDRINYAFPRLKRLRISDNPFYYDTKSADQRTLDSADIFMLVLARLPGLKVLNHSTITDQVRLNAEKFYQNQIVLELSRASAAAEGTILLQHPRWRALCEEYGMPEIARIDTSAAIDPSSLAARLVEIEFRIAMQPHHYLGPSRWTIKVPKSFNVYSLYGMVGEKLNEMPLDLRLVWQTNEKDPVAMAEQENDYWDSSDDEVNVEKWTIREVELVPGTRPLATYFEDRFAAVRIEWADVKPLRPIP